MTAKAGLPLTYRGTVYPWHCDHIGHMNVMWYVGKFDEATWNFLSGLGLTPSYLREADRGMAAVKQEITYHRELLAGDVVAVWSRLAELRDKVLRFRHEMFLEETGELVAATDLTAVHMDTKLRRACSLSPEVADKAGALLRAQTDKGDDSSLA